MEPKLLELVPYDHPGLRKKTQDVEFPLSDDDKHIIDSMLYSIQPEKLKDAQACYESAAGMAANQWGIDKSIFIYCPEGNHTKNIEVVINPSYEVLDESQDEGWEGCFSVPNANGNIKRYLKIRVKYQDLDGKIIEKELTDWFARVWQHENDHLNGFLFDDPLAGKCIEKVSFETEADQEAFFARIIQEREQGKENS